MMILKQGRVLHLLAVLTVVTTLNPSFVWGQSLPFRSQPQVSRPAQREVGRRTVSSIVPSYHVGPRARSDRPGFSVSGGVQFYVATNGNDDWTGRLPSPNPDRTDGPFATIEGARDKIRELREGGELSPPIIVNIRAGTYSLDQPFELEPQDSGSEGAPIVYRAYSLKAMTGRVVISGGRRITSEWRPVRGRLGEPMDIDFGSRPIVMTDIPALENGAVWRFNSFFVDGDRAVRARSPNPDDPFPYFQMENEILHVSYLNGVRWEQHYWTNSQFWCDLLTENQSSTCREDGFPDIPDNDYRSFLFQGTDIRGSWNNLREVEVVALKAWEQTRQKIDRVEAGRVYLQGASFKPTRWTPYSGRYSIENLRGALDSPGEWYLDRRNSRLYYWPLPGQDMNRVEVIAPVLTQLIKIHPGTHHITFQGLSFAHTDWVLSDQGHVGCMAAVCMATPPAIEFQASGPLETDAIGTERIRILDNTITHIGGYAIGGPTRRSVIRGNAIDDTGGGGIRIGGTDERCPDIIGWPLGEWDNQFLSEQNEIMDNTIHDIGKVYLESIALQDILSRNTTIAYNHIYNTPYSGISVGWAMNARPTRAQANRIENNEVHHVCQIQTDCAGIYTLGRQPGSFIRRNLVHDIHFTSHHSHRTSLMGIYLDQGSNGLTVSENIVYRIASAAFHTHQGSFNVIENNIFAYGSAAEELMPNQDYGQIGFASPFCAYDNGLSGEPRAVYRHPESGRMNWRNTQGEDCPEDRRGRRPPQGNIFQKNIIYGSPPRSDRKLIHYDRWPYHFVTSNQNLFFWPGWGRTTPGNLREWREQLPAAWRQDQNSIIDDPLFVDPSNGNFNLRPRSPASRIGFRPFTLTR